ncbi:MAG: NAD(P)H-dependent oxidoreductase [Betaproteobacteria bacterium]
MNVLIVFAHPEPQSFNAAMKDRSVEVLRAQGHEVVVSDLHAMGWKAVADAGDFAARANPDYLVYALEQRHGFRDGTLAADIRGELDKLMWADLVIFHFPLYWYSMPAIMKGWVDRVLISGLCYGGLRFYDRGGLRGKRAMLAVTLGGQPHMFSRAGVHGDLHLLLSHILRGTLAYVGFSVLPPFFAFHVPYISVEARQQTLQRYEQHLKGLETLPPLGFPSLDDFDEGLYPLELAPVCHG